MGIPQPPPSGLPRRRAALLLAAACAAVAGQSALPPPAAPAPAPRAGEALAPAEAGRLAAFGSAEALWGRGVEATIEEAYRACFRTLSLGGRFLTVRIPFAENAERSDLAAGSLQVRGGGKSDPALLWTEIEGLLAAPDFASYVAALSDGREKVIALDLEKGRWTVSRDPMELVRMRAGAYAGLPHRPLVLAPGSGVGAAEVYDYLRAVGRLGMDCSGFVWHVLRSVGARGGVDLDRVFARSSRSLSIGTWFFDPRNGAVREVLDAPARLQPGDVILFRDESGVAVHSAVIQSIDLAGGSIRYLQSTDEAPRPERGVHESLIRFDPATPELSLRDPSVAWLQERRAAFEGEPPSKYPDDGARYRAGQGLAGGTVVRLRVLQQAIDRIRAAAR